MVSFEEVERTHFREQLYRSVDFPGSVLPSSPPPHVKSVMARLDQKVLDALARRTAKRPDPLVSSVHQPLPDWSKDIRLNDLLLL